LYQCGSQPSKIWIIDAAGDIITTHTSPTGKCLEIQNGSGTIIDGTRLVINDCAGGNWQRWRVPDGVPMTARNRISYRSDSNKCLTGTSTSPGGQLKIAKCYGSSLQDWFVVRRSGATTVTVSARQLCMDTAAGSTSPGAKVIATTCNGASSQQWRVQANGSLLNVTSGLCLDTSTGSTAINSPMQLVACNGRPTQTFNIPTGYYYYRYST
jgi:hypothetical protein